MDIIKLDAGLQSSKRTKPVWYLIIHHTATRTPEATQRVLRARGLSTHYEVSPKGDIFEYLDPATRVAWHARSWNAHGIGIDLTGPPGREPDHHETDVDPYPDAQVQAFAWLVRHLAQRFKLPLEATTVRPWKRDPRLDGNAMWHHAPLIDGRVIDIAVVPHSAIQRGKVDPSDWKLGAAAWDTILRPAILVTP